MLFYALFWIIPPVILSIGSIWLGHRIRESPELIRRFVCKVFGNSSIIVGIIGTMFSWEVLPLVLHRSPDMIVEPWSINPAFVSVLLFLLGINLASNGIFIGKPIRPEPGFIASILGLVFNFSIFVYLAYGILSGAFY